MPVDVEPGLRAPVEPPELNERESMFRKLLPLAVIAVASGATAANAGAMTLSLGAASLAGRVAVTEPVTVTCSPFDPSLTLVAAGLTVTVEQASGRAIATGTGMNEGFLPALLPFGCDGSQTTVPVTVTASPTGAPFHGGKAVVSASASAGAGVPCFFGTTGCWSIEASQSASVGPTLVSLH